VKFVPLRMFAVLLLSSMLWAGTLSVQINDENGKPISARVYLRDAHDKPLLAPHTIQYARANKFGSEFHFVAPHGTFSIALPAGKYQLKIERGKEYLPVHATIIMLTGKSLTKDFQLKRWINMSSQDWYSADMHVHATLQNLPTLMEAEDLNVALPMTVWRLPGGLLQRDPGLNDCLENADSDGTVRVSRTRWFSCLNEELESWSSSLLVSHLHQEILPLRYPYVQIGQAAHARGAFTDSEKATALELPATAALGAVDFVGLANNHLWPSGCDLVHWGTWPSLLPKKYPFSCTGFVLANFDIYYALLQAGLPLRLSAGSAYGVHPVPVGWSRIYVHVPGQFTPESWFKALDQGHSFVTTGPMILLKANELEPGDESKDQKFPLIVNIDVEMLSNDPVGRAETVVNGSATPIELTADPETPNTYKGHTQITLHSSSWIAARFVTQSTGGIRLAHTSPVYFWKEVEALSTSSSQVKYLRDRVKALLAQVAAETDKMAAATDAKIVLDTPTRRKQTTDNFQKAVAFYDNLLVRQQHVHPASP
jgi:hypothetical protein